MGMNMSFMGGKGLSRSQIWSLIISTFYKQFDEKDVKDFDAFNVTVLDIFNTINMSLPGKHYDAPSHKDVMDLFKQWKEAEEETKKNIFTDFMNKNVNINKVDKSMIATAIVVPPAAMVAKRTGQITIPQLKLMQSIPDVVFVPSATILSFFTVKLLGIIFMGKKASRDAFAKDQARMDHEPQRSNSNNIPLKPTAQHREPASFAFWWTPEPASSQQPEPEPEPAPAQTPQQQPEQEPAPAPSAATSQQSEPATLATTPPAPDPASSAAAPATEPAHLHKPKDEENPAFCAICNRIH
ncbi:hypothetical protein RIF29_29862 [Crotalaria pallida]|uniref:Uncharacterized protein n=1 Tax=Crotalaria pallida TaxID=3830 RepID=A0AAN9EFN2_CROPI